MSLTLPGEFLGTEVVVTAGFGTDGKITATNQLGSDVNDTIDFFEEGFREGDKIRVVKRVNTDIIANNIAIPVNIPKYIVGIKLEKIKIENPKTIVIEVLSIAIPTVE